MVLFYQPPEPIYASLFAKVSGLSGFVTKSRRWRHWADVKPEEQPALFQVQPDPATMTYEWRANGAPLIRCKADFVIYCRTEETLAGVPAIKLNTLVGTLFGALEPAKYESSGRVPLLDVTTGQPVAYHARVNGDISMVEGVASDNAQSVAYVPIEILVNN